MGEDRVSTVAIGSPVKQASPKLKLDPKWEKGRILTSSCVACHGQVENGMWPRLSGQGKDYLIKALKDFRQGTRSDPLMAPIAKDLTDEDLEALATFFAAQKRASQ